MPQGKFCMILAVLHVSDDKYVPRGTPGHDHLAKIQPVYEHMRDRYKALYTPGMNICVDEAMCLRRGNLAFHVYMKDKPVKRGIKFYELCESEAAYVFDFEIFTAIPGLSNKPVNIVTRLAEPLLNKGRRIYVDNITVQSLLKSRPPFNPHRGDSTCKSKGNASTADDNTPTSTGRNTGLPSRYVLSSLFLIIFLPFSSFLSLPLFLFCINLNNRHTTLLKNMYTHILFKYLLMHSDRKK